MFNELSSNTRAVLLLTAPLIAGRGQTSAPPLSPGEYKRLAGRLAEVGLQPADLLGAASEQALIECRQVADGPKVERLLGRGFLLSQAVERWRARAIWVVCSADAGYPRRIKKHLGEDAPPVFYGCGDTALLDARALAVVGSRHVNDALIEYTERVGRLAAAMECAIVSGGARGIDLAAMRGALDAGGKTIGVLPDGLLRAAVNREHREKLMDGQLLLVSPYDPASGFHVGQAMQRNKLIYALADAALVVNADHGKGGTWSGAVEQLEKRRFVPVYTRATGDIPEGLEALVRKGARPWPEPRTREEFDQALAAPAPAAPGAALMLSLFSRTDDTAKARPVERAAEVPPRSDPEPDPDSVPEADASPAGVLFATVKELLEPDDAPKSESEIAEYLRLLKVQAKAWLKRLVAEGSLVKSKSPVRYSSPRSNGSVPEAEEGKTPADVLFAAVRRLLEQVHDPRSASDIAEDLKVTKGQARAWLKRLVSEGSLVKSKSPVRYNPARADGTLFHAEGKNARLPDARRRQATKSAMNSR